MTAAIILFVMVIFVLALQIVRMGASYDWRRAKLKCKDCIFFEEADDDLREVFCLLKRWRTTDEILECEDRKEYQ